MMERKWKIDEEQYVVEVLCHQVKGGGGAVVVAKITVCMGGVSPMREP